MQKQKSFKWNNNNNDDDASNDDDSNNEYNAKRFPFAVHNYSTYIQ